MASSRTSGDDHAAYLLTQEDQKVVNRWRLVVVTIYSSVALALVLFVAFSPAGRDGGSK
jgi:hypothetical protein